MVWARTLWLPSAPTRRGPSLSTLVESRDYTGTCVRLKRFRYTTHNSEVIWQEKFTSLQPWFLGISLLGLSLYGDVRVESSLGGIGLRHLQQLQPSLNRASHEPGVIRLGKSLCSKNRPTISAKFQLKQDIIKIQNVTRPCSARRTCYSGGD